MERGKDMIKIVNRLIKRNEQMLLMQQCLCQFTE